ncbi:PREDICTED: peflin-like [Nicrophorus vespilloides]|uniref:Peflin-like n=1 Tax=Nicrophorus vespilloides TaxID=110193 RepID=A0ABM1MPZ8_NICVS|nr:PREDICTED: peflin-like [Nicrophorus vespilloides]
MNQKDQASETTKTNAEKPPPVFSEVQKWFQSSESKRDGKISPKELQTAFEVFQGKHFSDGACKFIVRLFDLDKRGGLDIKEFEQLYYFIKQWVSAFHSFDYQRSGFLDEEEFAGALKHMDINFSPDFVRFLMKRADPTKDKIALDQFIVTCIQIQKYTEEFKQRDANYTGEIQLKYEDFLEMLLKCM